MVAVPNRDRRAEQREATAEILDAAWEVARAQGLAQLTLREVAQRVGMRAPSLYGHFGSKHAIYDAMFQQAWETYERRIDGLEARVSADPRAALKVVAASFVDYALEDLPRHQLMNVRMIPGFQPSPRVRAVAAGRPAAAGHPQPDRHHRPRGRDLLTALTGGLVEQQWANDPGGDRWRRLLDRVIDMYADEMGLPGPRRRTP